MNEDKIQQQLKRMYVKTGSLEALINYLNQHPTELGSNNKFFKDTIQEIIDLIVKAADMEDVELERKQNLPQG